jgi:hypothetical protein
LRFFVAFDLACSEKLNFWQGLDTETPFLKLGDKIYEGRFEYTVGTHLFFEQGRMTLKFERFHELRIGAVF